MISSILIFAFCVIFAGVSAWYEYVRVEEETPGSSLNHSGFVLKRIIWIASFIFLCYWVESGWGEKPGPLLLLAWITMSWGSFVPTHRFLFNKFRRHFPWNYLSPSSNYDLWWISNWYPLDVVKDPYFYHQLHYGKNKRYTRLIHRAGTTAYVTEVIVGMFSVALIAKLVNLV